MKFSFPEIQTWVKLNPAANKNVSETTRGLGVIQSSMDTVSTSVLNAKTESRMWPIHLGNAVTYGWSTKSVLTSAHQVAHSTGQSQVQVKMDDNTYKHCLITYGTMFFTKSNA